MTTIGIFPAAGALGGSTYTHLLRLVPHDRVVLVCRHPDKVPASYVASGVRARQASYESTPAELEAAFAGVDVLFLVSYPSHVHGYRVKVQLPAVDAARRAGVRHVVYSSLAFAGPAEARVSKAVVMQAHLDTEAHLRSLAEASSSDGAKGAFAFTSIREGLYAESTPIYTAFFNPAAAAKDRAAYSPERPLEVRIPHDGSAPGVAWAKRDELGEASAKIITAVAGYSTAVPPSAYANATVLLTGPRAWTLAETVSVLADIAGLAPGAARVREVSVDEYVAQEAVVAVFGADAPPDNDKARTWATAWAAIRAGETAVVSPALGEVLGRAPTAFDVAAREWWTAKMREG